MPQDVFPVVANEKVFKPVVIVVADANVLDALKQAVWLNQDFSGPYILLGKVELKKGDAQRAGGFLERALKIDPNNFSAHCLLGSTYKELGRLPDADHEFELSRTLHGDQK